MASGLHLLKYEIGAFKAVNIKVLVFKDLHTDRWLSTFQRNLLPPFWVYKMEAALPS
jgi:hypothetical protein